MNDFAKLMELVRANMDNPNELSKLLVEVAAYFYTHTQLTSHFELEEKKALVGNLDARDEAGKKPSVAESEVRAVVDTQNQYGLSKNEDTAIQEMINSIKKRLDVNMSELKLTK